MIKEALNNDIIDIVKERIKEELIDFRIPYIFVRYDGKAKCHACGYETTKNAVLKHNSQCPNCGVVMSQESNIRKSGATIVVEKTANGIIVFRFLTIEFLQNFDGLSEEIKEEFRIYCDQNANCSVYRLNSNGKYAKYKEKDLPYTVHYRESDILGHHIFTNFAEEDDFVQSLDFLFDDTINVSTVFTAIIQSAKYLKINDKCDDFFAPMPSNDLLVNKYTGGYTYEGFHMSSPYGRNFKHEFWCGKCGKYSEFFSENRDTSHWELDRICNCSNKNGILRFHRIGSTFIDVEQHSNCTMLRFTNYKMQQYIDSSIVINGKDTTPQKAITDVTVFYAVFYNNGKCLLFDEDKNVIIDPKQHFSHYKLANPEIINKLKQFPEIVNSGFIDYGLATGNWTGEFLLSYCKTEVVRELSNLGLYSLIKSIIKTDTNKIPAYLLKKRKFNIDSLSDEQIKDLACSNVDVSNFVSYMKALKKDSTAKYSDFETLIKMSAKSCIDEIFRRIPNAKMSDIKRYIEDRKAYECCYPQEAMIIWSEYLNLANKYGLDMQSTATLYPHNLKVQADILKRNAIKYLYKTSSVEKFEKNAQKITNISFATNDFCIYPILSIEEYHQICDNLNFPTIEPFYGIGRSYFFVVKNAQNEDVAIVIVDNIDVANGNIISGSLSRVTTNGDIHILGGYRSGAETSEHEEINEFVLDFCAQNCIS